jgi:hypothetical protein
MSARTKRHAKYDTVWHIIHGQGDDSMIHLSSRVREVARLTFVPGSLASKDLCGELVAGLGRAADASLREVNGALVLGRVTRSSLAAPNPVPVRPVGE